MRLDRKPVVVGSLTAIAVAGGFLINHFAFGDPTPSFRFATVERGDLISELPVDFNDEVKTLRMK